MTETPTDGWSTEYRIQEYRVPVRTLLTFLFQQRGVPEFVALPELKIPDGARVLQTSIDPMSGALRCWVEHPSFDIVPDGCDPPLGCANVMWTTHRILPTEPVEKPKPVSYWPEYLTELLPKEAVPTVIPFSQETPGG